MCGKDAVAKAWGLWEGEMRIRREEKKGRCRKTAEQCNYSGCETLQYTPMYVRSYSTIHNAKTCARKSGVKIVSLARE